MKLSYSVAGLLILMLVLFFSVTQVIAYEPPPGVIGPEEVDFGGRTVNFYSWVTSPFDRFEKEGWVPGRIEEAEEKFNVNIEFEIIGTGVLIDRLTTDVLAGEGEYDWYFFEPSWGGWSYWSLVTAGILFPVQNLLPDTYFDDLSLHDRHSTLAFSHEGTAYGFGHALGPWNWYVGMGMYNEDLLEREGVPDPYELWQKNEWTWDAVTEIARQITKDTTGDGEIDQWGLGHPYPGERGWFYNSMAQGLAWANNAVLTREVDGRIVFSFDEEPALQAYDQVFRWAKEDNVFGMLGVFAEGDVGIIPRGHLHHMSPYGAMPLRDIGEIARLIPVPWGPYTEDDFFYITSTRTWLLPITVAEPEKMIALHSFMWQKDDGPETLEDFVHRVPGQAQEIVQTRECMEILRLAHERFRLPSPYLPITSGFIGSAAGDIFEKEVDVATAMASIKPVAQAALDEVLEQ